MNVDAEPVPISEDKTAAGNKMNDDFSAQVIKENNLLRAQTSKKYQRNEPIIESGAHADPRQGKQELLQPFGNPMPQPRYDNQNQQMLGAPYNHLLQVASAPRQGNHHASLSTISIQD